VVGATAATVVCRHARSSMPSIVPTTNPRNATAEFARSLIVCLSAMRLWSVSLVPTSRAIPALRLHQPAARSLGRCTIACSATPAERSLDCSRSFSGSVLFYLHIALPVGPAKTSLASAAPAKRVAHVTEERVGGAESTRALAVRAVDCVGRSRR
jgi:hypothetical protein